MLLGHLAPSPCTQSRPSSESARVLLQLRVRRRVVIQEINCKQSALFRCHIDLDRRWSDNQLKHSKAFADKWRVYLAMKKVYILSIAVKLKRYDFSRPFGWRSPWYRDIYPLLFIWLSSVVDWNSYQRASPTRLLQSGIAFTLITPCFQQITNNVC